MSGTLARMSGRLDFSGGVDGAPKPRNARGMNERAVPADYLILPALRTPPANDFPIWDAQVARALVAMRAAPGRRWTVASLARVACLSRAPFARRFRRATGMAPLAWLRALRLGLAQRELVTSDATLAAIAAAIGYASEFALSKAFKRLVGVAPAIFRRSAGRLVAPAAFPRFRAAA
jgi:AraC-like DNA-binding protein